VVRKGIGKMKWKEKGFQGVRVDLTSFCEAWRRSNGPDGDSRHAFPFLDVIGIVPHVRLRTESKGTG
jgi:hypothetical protein